jgi:long-chain acyl-CoA synthetase
MNIARNLERSAFFFPHRPAVIEGSKEISFQQFNQEANRVAAGLIDLGVQKGDHVALCATNSYTWLAFYFGTLKVGAVAVTLSTALQKTELNRLLDDARPKILFTVDEKLDALGDRQDRPYLAKVICPAGDISYQKLIENTGTSSLKALEMERRDVAAILYTGGTTGIPKGVMLTHENIMASAHNVCHFERSSHQDRFLCFLPLNHVFGQIHIINSMVYAGGSVVMQPSFDLDRVVDAIKRCRITKFYAVPTIYVRLLQLKGLKEKLGSVTYCFSAAASMAAELIREWNARTRLNIHESYGMTETAAMVTYNHYLRHVAGSVGTPVNITEVQIRDPQGAVLEVGARGEICVRGPNIMKGYLNNPAETRAAFWDDWLRSGDLGTFDENGYLYLVDRIKDMIITGGENVYPREIEEILYQRSEIQECSIIGLPDEEYGERVTACIVPKHKDVPLDLPELKIFLKTQLASFKIPKEFIILEELPKLNTGKTPKRVLKKQVMEKTKDYSSPFTYGEKK